MAKPSDELPEAPQSHLNDDPQTVAPEPSIATIIDRIKARSNGSSADAQNGGSSPPFARSRFPGFSVLPDQGQVTHR